MQGGFITAAFDNAFGPLCLITTSAANTTTLYINTTYHRPIFPGDELTINARIKSNGRTMVYMTAEGYNKEGQLIASAHTQYFILNQN
jgi:acyl-coenzyme A thioesterase PaaI-like protein